MTIALAKEARAGIRWGVEEVITRGLSVAAKGSAQDA